MPTSTRRPLDHIAISTMVVCCLFLGLSNIAIKLSHHEISPVMQLSMRSLFGLLILLGFMVYQKELRFNPKQIKLGLFVGALFAFESLLAGESLRYTSASRSVVFLYTSPLFSALFLHFLVKDERLSWVQWLGMGLAFGGIAVAFLLSSQADGSLLGDGLALAAGLSWGLTTVIIRMTSLGTLPAKQVLAYQLFAIAVLLWLYAIATDQAVMNWQTASVLSVGFQAVFVAFLATVAWFWLLTRYRSADIGALILMTPIFGVVLGAWILGDEMTTSFIVGAVMVLVGIVLVGRRVKAA